MPSIKFTIQAEIDGVPLNGFPLVRRVSVAELQTFEYEEANDGNTTTFSDIPVGQLDSIQALLVRPDQQVNVRIDGQTDAGIIINAGGILLIIDGTNDAGSNRARVNNNSGNTANLRGFGAGT